ncbi:MAG TPA: hypothetical protein VIY51_15530 [Xanthobacteraceae bacterium]
MSPARAGADGIDLHRLVRRIVLDVSLLHWFATTGGRGLAVIAAIVAARHEARGHGGRVLDFLERHVGGEQ